MNKSKQCKLSLHLSHMHQTNLILFAKTFRQEENVLSIPAHLDVS